jgi:thiol-disulfide isomerase/thioredoxin
MQRRSAAAALFFVSVGALACGGAGARPGPGGNRAAAARPDPLRAIRVTAPDGRPVALGDLGGGDAITVVALWATWCEPCLDELPRIDDLRQQYAGDRRIRFIALNVDDEPRVAAGAVERMGLTLPSYRDGAALMNALSPRGADGKPRTGLPLVAVIDWRAHPARVHRRFGYDPAGGPSGSIAGLTEVVEAARRGGELPPERLLLAADPESPMVLAVPRMNERERRQHLIALRAQLTEMFPRFTAPQLDRVLERAAEVSVEGGNLLISVPADIPLRSARGGGGPIPFY